MSKNFNLDTDKLLIMIYPPGGGGNLINVCLSIHPFVLNQHEQLAKIKMKLSSSAAGEFGKKIAESLFNLKESKNKHLELGWCPPSDFDYSLLDKKPDHDFLQDELWEDLTNQDQYYFIMNEHNDSLNMWNKYKNRKSIKLFNTKWILDSRRQPMKNFDETVGNKKNQFNFDMATVKAEEAFTEEMQKLYHHLGLGEIDVTPIKQIRANFINTFQIGWKTQNEENGRYRWRDFEVGEKL